MKTRNEHNIFNRGNLVVDNASVEACDLPNNLLVSYILNDGCSAASKDHLRSMAKRNSFLRFQLDVLTEFVKRHQINSVDEYTRHVSIEAKIIMRGLCPLD